MIFPVCFARVCVGGFVVRRVEKFVTQARNLGEALYYSAPQNKSKAFDFEGFFAISSRETCARHPFT
jgi:hypothetical protein